MYEKMATFVLFSFFFFLPRRKLERNRSIYTCICYLIERKYSLKIIIIDNIEDWKG